MGKRLKKAAKETCMYLVRLISNHPYKLFLFLLFQTCYQITSCDIFMALLMLMYVEELEDLI